MTFWRIQNWYTVILNLVKMGSTTVWLRVWNTWHFVTFSPCLDVNMNNCENISEKPLFRKFIFALDRKAVFSATHSKTNVAVVGEFFELAVSVPHFLVFLLCQGMTRWARSFQVKEVGMTFCEHGLMDEILAMNYWSVKSLKMPKSFVDGTLLLLFTDWC